MNNMEFVPKKKHNDQKANKEGKEGRTKNCKDKQRNAKMIKALQCK